ncbi:DNA primase [hydrothermal vent metagenome]|uniref:DNA primase n=1 Tax=hydrothermal vent metagenome TaxID=652676 RepID=A0A3B1CAL3_9ZZZZ
MRSMSGHIPQSFIDDLINRIDIVEIVDSRVPLKKTGREYIACCPFHDEKTASFSVSSAKQFYHCFGCGAHGTAVGFLMEYDHMSFPEAIEELARQAGLDVPYEGGARAGVDPGQKKQSQDLYAVLDRADQFYQQQLRQHPQAQRAIDYLKQRGLSGQIAVEFGIGFAPPGWDNMIHHMGSSHALQEQLVTTGMLIRKDDGRCYDRFRDRIMFPIRDLRGRCIGFGGRILPDVVEANQDNSSQKPAKYLNSPETPLFHKGQELYGLFEARRALRDISRLLVVEGYMDVVALAEAGIRYVVATLGTATTADHLKRLFRLCHEVVFCFDGDRAGREAAWRALENALPVMQDGRQIRFMFLPDGEDPDTQVKKTGATRFEADIDAAMPFSTFFFERLKEPLDMNSLDGRAQLDSRASPLLAKLPDGVMKQTMKDQLGRFTRRQNQNPVRQYSAGAYAPRRHQAAPKRSTPSPVRYILQRLLHQPTLAQQAGDLGRFSQGDVPGLDLLLEVLEILQKHTTLRAGSLIEHFRDSDKASHLQKLAVWQPEVGDEVSLVEEFTTALNKLEQACLQQRYDALLAQSNLGQLSAADEAEYLELFRKLNKNKYKNA